MAKPCNRSSTRCRIGNCKRLKPTKKYLRDFFLINDSAEAFEESDIMIGVKYLLEYSRSVDKPMVIFWDLEQEAVHVQERRRLAAMY